MSFSHLYVFGDQTWQVESSLQKLIGASREEPCLRQFFEEIFIAVKQEISHLPRVEQKVFPSADTLSLLLDACRKGSQHAALNAGLAVTNQIALYLRSRTRLEKGSPAQNDFGLLGICTGSFASAVVACARIEHDLIQLGVQAVRIAFRVGLIVSRKAASIAPRSSEPWSAIVSNVTQTQVCEVLDQLHDISESRAATHVYVSGVGPNAITLSGPPRTLRQLLDTNPFGLTCKTSYVPIQGPYHDPNSSSDRLATEILRDLIHGDETVQVPSLQCHSGSLTNAATFRELLSEAIVSVLTQTVRMDKVADFLLEREGISKVTGFHSHAPASLASFLASKKARTVHTQHAGPDHIPSTPRSVRTTSGKIAIIGFSGRFPEADSLDEFWDVLTQGIDTMKPTPADRFDASLHYDPSLQKKNTSRIRHGCWIRRPDLFDSHFFRISPREAAQSDPAQRLALLTAYEALEMAGFVPDSTDSTRRHRVGVFYGTTSDDWREVNSGQNVDTYFIPGGNRAFIPGRINYFFKFSGPSISVDTACASSLAAINIGVNSLLNGDCDSVIAGGTNVMTNPDNFAGLDRGHFLSPTGNCKTFDDSADGYCRADGVGTVVLKRLEDAIADKDPIFGVMLGARTNHSAEAVSITRPLADAQEYLFKRLLNDCHITPHDISYVEMHGTGTQAGDAVEMTSVLNCFAWDHSRQSNNKLYLGSAKANFGHGESASGVTALIKVLMMMKHDTIPRNIGIKGKINTQFPKDLAERKVHIAMENTRWPRPADPQKRRAFINNFSAAGGNTTLMIEDADVTVAGSSPDLRGTYVVTASASTSKSLRGNLISLANYIEQTPPSQNLLAQLAYTTSARRIHHNRRAAFAVKDSQQLVVSIRQTAESADAVLPTAREPGIGFLFTGQGAADTAMGQSLYRDLPSFRNNMDSLDEMIQGMGHPSIASLFEGDVPIDQLSTVVVHVGICAFQIGLARFWMRLGLRPRYLLGHSLGEYATLHIAGVLTLYDALWLCAFRARLIEKRCTVDTHGMLAVNAPVNSLQQLTKELSLEVACINGPQDTVLSGNKDNLATAAKRLQTEATIHKALPISFAYHSAQMADLQKELEQGAAKIEFSRPQIPVVSTLLAQVVTEEGIFGPEYIRRHSREPVNFVGAVQAAVQSKMSFQTSDINIEIGAHPLIQRMVKMTLGSENRTLATMRRNEDNFHTMAETLQMLYSAGVGIAWDQYHNEFPSSQKVLQLPSYQWDYGSHWIMYENSWCLTKGDAIEAATQTAPSTAKQGPRLSDSVHQLVERIDDGMGKTRLIGRSNLHDPHLRPVTDQHRVNGLTLVPSSLYADVIFTLGMYLIEKCSSDPSQHATLMPDVRQMVVEEALIVDSSKESQLFEAVIEFDWSTLCGLADFYSVDAAGARGTKHAQCEIQLRDPTARFAELKTRLPLIKRAVAHLAKSAEMGVVHRLGRGLAYKLFGSSVQYGQMFQGMKEVHFDSQQLEASAKVQLQANSDARFRLNPYWVDSFGHLTGFIMNSNDSLDLETNVYVNHGWESMYISEAFSSDAEYQTFVSMQPLNDDDSAFSGDVYVLRNDQIVAVYGQVTFNKISKKILEMLLPRAPSRSAALAKPRQTAAKHEQAATHAPAARVAKRVNSKRQDSAMGSTFEKVLQVIGEAAGMSSESFLDEMVFPDLGVDSLMSLTIVDTLRSSLGLDVPSSLFMDYNTVKDLRQFVAELQDETSAENASRDESMSGSPSDSHKTLSEAQTPLTDVDDVQGGLEATIQLILTVIAEELGVKLQDLSDCENLADLGMDSLMALTILSKVCDELGIDLAPAFFLSHLSVSDVKQGLRTALRIPSDAPSPPPATQPSVPQASAIPQATSVVLQPGRGEHNKTLFLFPDGSGSATSYMAIPEISPDVRVIGLNCPYLKTPELLQCGIQDLTASYLSEIRRRKPQGPYSLAGWSAGGIAAYHAVQVLLDSGWTVERLILIDSPNPIGLSKLPPRFYKSLEDAGAFGDASKAPKWLLEHFLAFIEALDKYKPTPMTSQPFKTTIIWAAEPVTKDLKIERERSTETREMQWLMDKRTDLNFNGWDYLLKDTKNVDVVTVAGANHFNMVRPPFAKDLSLATQSAMA